MIAVTLIAVPILPERQRRALAFLAAAAVPSTEWPRALMLIGLASVEAALSPNRPTAVFWLGAGAVDGLLGSPALTGYIRDGVRIIVLARSYDDARTIAAALQRRAA